LEVCWIVQGQTPARIRQNGTLMFADLSLPVMLKLTYQILTENLAGFFPTELPKDSAAAPAK